MGAAQSNAGPRVPSNVKERPKSFSYMERRIMKKYLPSFIYTEKSTENHRQIAGRHWEKVFSNKRKSTDGERGKKAREAGHIAPTTNNKITELYDIFYHFLEEHGSELRHVFRSSMHVRGRVLVHISAGMRAMLGSESGMMEKIAKLTVTHRRFGVKPQHYDTVGTALLYAMERTSGPSNWSPEIADAWRRMFGHVSIVLIRDQLKNEKKYEKTQQQGGKGRDKMHSVGLTGSVTAAVSATKSRFAISNYIPSIRNRSVRDSSSVSHKTTMASGQDG